MLDLYGGHAVASLGYGHQGWTKALSDQAAQMNFQTNAVPMEIRARAAHKLLKFSKLPFDSVFWINSGAEANENAFKMAFKMRPGRTHVAAVEQSFHGRTAACASTTWQAPQKWFFLPRAPFDVSWIKRRDIADIANHVTENTAAVIVEPVQGVGGAFDMGQEFLAALRKRCDETGALLIFDEVQCGVGRTGQPFAANYYGVMPDMITTAKALGNGFPVSALLLTPPITAVAQAREPRHHVRRRPHGLRRGRSHHRRHREGRPAGQRAPRVGLSHEDLRGRARSWASRARVSWRVCA